MVRLFRSTLPFRLTDLTNEYRRFGVSGNRRPRRQVWTQGLQDIEDPSYHYSRLNCVLPDYFFVSLHLRDDTAIGEGERYHYRE